MSIDAKLTELANEVTEYVEVDSEEQRKKLLAELIEQLHLTIDTWLTEKNAAK